MSRINEIIEIENRMEFYFQDLECDVSFTEEQIRQFHSDWHRLNHLDPSPRPTQRKQMTYSLLCLITLCLLRFIIAKFC